MNENVKITKLQFIINKIKLDVYTTINLGYFLTNLREY